MFPAEPPVVTVARVTTRHGGALATDGATMIGESTVPSTHVTNPVNLIWCAVESAGNT